jgi:hypothetical protein
MTETQGWILIALVAIGTLIIRARLTDLWLRLDLLLDSTGRANESRRQSSSKILEYLFQIRSYLRPEDHHSSRRVEIHDDEE